MQILGNLWRLISSFGGVLGVVEVLAAMLVAGGCAGELWILINKLTRHVEPLGKNLNSFWRILSWLDSKCRPLSVRLKINGRKLSEAKENLLERLFVMTVAIGVAIELVAVLFSLRENAQLHRDAGEAKGLAAAANERTAIIESNNLVLRSNVAVLEFKLQPRIIYPQQITNFVYLTQLIPKIPIKICTVIGPDDSATFAIQLRGILRAAGFGTDPSANLADVTLDERRPFVYRPLGAQDKWPFVFFVTHGTNNYKQWDLRREAHPTNGLSRLIVLNADTNLIYAAIVECLNDVGIPAQWMNSVGLVGPGECEFFVPHKND
jgi:hypothetical protein